MRERVEQQRHTAFRGQPGNGNVWQPCSRAHNAGHIGFDNSGELRDIKMTPFYDDGDREQNTGLPQVGQANRAFLAIPTDGNRTGVFHRESMALPWSGRVENNMSVEDLSSMAVTFGNSPIKPCNRGKP